MMKKILMILSIAVALCNYAGAQDTGIHSLLRSKHFIFQPVNMIPASGRLRVLENGYFLQIKNDTLIANLPYFGKAYTAPVNAADAGYNFISTDFDYSISTGKKGSLIATIKTNDRVYNTTFTLSVFKNGTAYLLANSPDKQQVSYNGSIQQSGS
jgi:hypothetical protein